MLEGSSRSTSSTLTAKVSEPSVRIEKRLLFICSYEMHRCLLLDQMEIGSAITEQAQRNELLRAVWYECGVRQVNILSISCVVGANQPAKKSQGKVQLIHIRGSEKLAIPFRHTSVKQLSSCCNYPASISSREKVCHHEASHSASTWLSFWRIQEGEDAISSSTMSSFKFVCVMSQLTPFAISVVILVAMVCPGLSPAGFWPLCGMVSFYPRTFFRYFADSLIAEVSIGQRSRGSTIG